MLFVKTAFDNMPLNFGAATSRRLEWPALFRLRAVGTPFWFFARGEIRTPSPLTVTSPTFLPPIRQGFGTSKQTPESFHSKPTLPFTHPHHKPKHTQPPLVFFLTLAQATFILSYSKPNEEKMNEIKIAGGVPISFLWLRMEQRD